MSSPFLISDGKKLVSLTFSSPLLQSEIIQIQIASFNILELSSARLISFSKPKLFRIIVKTFIRFTTEPSGINIFFQKWTRTVFWVA